MPLVEVITGSNLRRLSLPAGRPWRRLPATSGFVEAYPAGHSAQGATVDTCHVVAGIGQVDRAGVYVPLTRGWHENHLYLMETTAGDLDTGHGSLLVEQRRETAEYACGLLIQAAKRDRADITPQHLWRDARADFELAKLSSNLVVDHDPYAGTQMAVVMAQRQGLRRARLFLMAFIYLREEGHRRLRAFPQLPSRIVRIHACRNNDRTP